MSSDDLAISVRGVGKSYAIAHQSQRSMSFSEAVAHRLRHPFGNGRRETETFWALKDVSFEVRRGEVLGLIGRNGAGKSTILKILSRITTPTAGEIDIYGRVASLLEVGTGFHPELTGRENIYLNGAVLGMTRREIERKFDEIVEFAGIEQFLDTPVKRYSSGMTVRLGFAIASHLEPEILIIDEVLAVGDAIFQRRCIDRMSEMARSGRTLLFVSHNMEVVPKLCTRAVLLEGGKLVASGLTRDVIETYLSNLDSAGEESLAGHARRGDGRARFERVSFKDEHGNPLSALTFGDDFRCLLEVRSDCHIKNVSLAVALGTPLGARVMTGWTDDAGRPFDLVPGLQRFECHFKKVRLRPGCHLAVELWMSDGEEIDWIENAGTLEVVGVDPMGHARRPEHGPYLCDYSWSTP